MNRNQKVQQSSYENSTEETSQVSAKSESSTLQESSDCYKARTISGSSETPCVSQLRNFFVVNSGLNKRKREEEKCSEKVSPTFRKSSQRKLSGAPVQQTVKKLKGKARKLALQKKTIGHGHAPVGSKQNKLNKFLIKRSAVNSEQQQRGVLSDSSYVDTSESETNTSRGNWCEESDTDNEDFFLNYLASTLKPIDTDQESEGSDQTRMLQDEKEKETIHQTTVEEEVVNEGNKNSASPTTPDQLSESVNSHNNQQGDDEMETESNNEGNPQAIGALEVSEMFKQLKESLMAEIKEVKTEVKTIKLQRIAKVSDEIVQKTKDQVMEMVNHHLESDGGSHVNKLKQELNHVKVQNKTLTDVVENMSLEMADLRMKLENIELSNSKKYITISGLYTYGKRYEIQQQIESFFEETLGLHVKVDDFFQMGIKMPKLSVVSFQNPQSKKDVMKLKYLLKHHRNEDNKSIFINDYTPTATIEKRFREKQIRKENSETQNQLDISTVKGTMHIQGEMYIPKIQVPSPKQLIQLTPEQMKEILKMEVKTGGKITQEKSVFVGFAANVTNFEQIRQVYKKLKLCHPTARHIVCAYWLENVTEPHHAKGFCDDGEPGAGRRLMELLTLNNIKDKVVFVTRKYGGIRMGADRFECYIQAIKSVIQQHPYNDKVGQNQQITVDKPPPRIPKKQATPPGSPKETKISMTPRRRQGRRGGATYGQRGRNQRYNYYQQKPQQQHDKNFQTIRGAYRGWDTRAGHRYQKYQDYQAAERQQMMPYYNHQPHGMRSRSNSWSYNTYEDWENPDDGQFYHKQSASQYGDQDSVQ